MVPWKQYFLVFCLRKATDKFFTLANSAIFLFQPKKAALQKCAGIWFRTASRVRYNLSPSSAIEVTIFFLTVRSFHNSFFLYGISFPILQIRFVCNSEFAFVYEGDLLAFICKFYKIKIKNLSDSAFSLFYQPPLIVKFKRDCYGGAVLIVIIFIRIVIPVLLWR